MGILVEVVWSSPFRITVFFDDFGSFIQNLSTLWSVDRLAHGYEKEIVGYQGKIITIIIIKSWWSAWWQWKVQVGYLEAESWQMSRPRGQDQKIRRLLEESSSYDHSQHHGHNHEKEKKVDCCCYVLHKCNKHNLYPGIATFFTTHFIQQ